MTIGDAIAGALPRLRSAAESMMVDTCTITRPSGPPVFDQATGTYTNPTPTTVYSGKCRVRLRSNSLRDRRAEIDGTETILWPYVVSVPVSDVDVKVLDTVKITNSQDAALAGRVMRVQDASIATDSTARRFNCEEIAS